MSEKPMAHLPIDYLNELESKAEFIEWLSTYKFFIEFTPELIAEFISTNPNSPYDWIYEYFDKETIEQELQYQNGNE